MGIKQALEKHLIRGMVGRIEFMDTRLRPWALAVIAALVPLFAGVAPHLEDNTLTVAALASAVSAAVLAALGKVMSPGATLHVPRVGKALVLAVGAALPMIGAAAQDGVISGQEWGGIVAAFLTVAWAKWTSPDKVLG